MVYPIPDYFFQMNPVRLAEEVSAGLFIYLLILVAKNNYYMNTTN